MHNWLRGMDPPASSLIIPIDFSSRLFSKVWPSLAFFADRPFDWRRFLGHQSPFEQSLSLLTAHGRGSVLTSIGRLELIIKSVSSSTGPANESESLMARVAKAVSCASVKETMWDDADRSSVTEGGRFQRFKSRASTVLSRRT